MEYANNALQIDPGAVISPDARIFPSTRGTLIRIGSGTHVMEYAVIRAVGGTGDVLIGENCRINPHCVLYSGSGIRIGNYVAIAPGTAIVPANHAFPRRDIPIAHQGFMPSRGGVVVEDDVWIGANCVLTDGARIGRGAVVAAGSVVTGEVSAFSIWGGTPARFIKERP
jgi:acetyltransferase-like isoleucine patch superfamily enzyme